MEMIKIMGSPCMQSVTSLDWCISNFPSSNDNHLESFLKDTTALPNLQELHHNGTLFDDLLLRHRPIRRLRGTLYCEGDMLLTNENLGRGNLVLTHLNLQDFVKRNLFDIIEQDLNPLRNLRHIGTFYYDCRRSDFELALLEDLSRCACLSKLVSFDVCAPYTVGKLQFRKMRSGLKSKLAQLLLRSHYNN
ncbi:hypothetical protein CPB86DRAFT_102244 [Serendipita vermifera]|nr:hypothetical protein CPB86DRAFT_102244 [Serendipita vermifera]